MDTQTQQWSWKMGLTVFVFSATMLLFQLCLTRVLSVVFFYHTAFFAVSLAMLGLAAGGVWAFLRPVRSETGLVRWLLVTTIGMLFVPLLFGLLRFDVAWMQKFWHPGFLSIFALVALCCFLPFAAGGVVLAVWFQRYRADATALYAWDLIGAALGALVLVPVMESLGGPSALLCCAVLMALVTVAMLRYVSSWRWRGITGGALVLCSAIFVWQMATDGLAIQIDMKRSTPRHKKLFKKWNAFSRVVLLPSQGWSRALSLSRENVWKGKAPEQMEALIDINAYAPFMRFDGDIGKLGMLKELVSNAGYLALPSQSDVLVIGPGGGKDILGALAFQAKHVTAIELNPVLIQDLLAKRLRKFSGNLIAHPKVKILVGDARGVVRGLSQSFDLIVANSVFTWAAHSSGALNLAEHSLYTVESCGLYLDRLRRKGLLSISLWDVQKHALPLRWLQTCAVAAKQRGIQDFASHIAVLANRWDNKSWFSSILLSRSPWTTTQRKALREFAQRYNYEIHYLPQFAASSPVFKRYFADPKAFAAAFRYKISPVTDDRPFFLHTVRWPDLLAFWRKDNWAEDAAVLSLWFSLFWVCLLLLVVVFAPLRSFRLRNESGARLRWSEIGYFLAIGLGFMAVEVPLIQRLTLYLGHPTYALTVVLAGLLLWSGLGSWAAGRATEGRLWLSRGLWALIALLALGFVGLGALLHATQAWSLTTRMVLVLLLLLPLGGLMGMPLPLMMQGFDESREAAIPWAWAVNGASSVLASVAVLWSAAAWGFQATLLVAIGCYTLAWLCLRRSATSVGE